MKQLNFHYLLKRPSRLDNGVKFNLSDSEQISTPKMSRRGTIANIKAIMHIKSNKVTFLIHV